MERSGDLFAHNCKLLLRVLGRVSVTRAASTQGEADSIVAKITEKVCQAPVNVDNLAKGSAQQPDDYAVGAVLRQD